MTVNITATPEPTGIAERGSALKSSGCSDARALYFCDPDLENQLSEPAEAIPPVEAGAVAP
jgi:hypothetical protein